MNLKVTEVCIVYKHPLPTVTSTVPLDTDTTGSQKIFISWPSEPPRSNFRSSFLKISPSETGKWHFSAYFIPRLKLVTFLWLLSSKFFFQPQLGSGGGKRPEYKHSLSGEFSEVRHPSATETGDSVSSFVPESACHSANEIHQPAFCYLSL